MSPHQLRLFLANLADAAWLGPLHDVGLLCLPQPNGPWPVLGLLEGLGKTAPAAVAEILNERLLADAKKLPSRQRLNAEFELLRVAVQLGAAGHRLVITVARLHPINRAVRSLAVAALQQAEAADPVVASITDVIVGAKPMNNDHYHVVAALDRFVAGLDPDNVVERTRMLVGKVCRIVRDAGMRFVVLDIARLTAPLRDERRYPVIAAHYLAVLLARARELGVPATDLLAWTANVSGEIGERLTCRIMEQATDVPLHDKIQQVELRISSATATGDDLDLITDVLSAKPQPAALDRWAAALGKPSEDPSDLEQRMPDDWTHAWRWSSVLPEVVLTEWQDAIAEVTRLQGSPLPESLDRRVQLPSGPGRSAFSEEELSTNPPLAAAELVAAWRPDTTNFWSPTGARETARTLEAVVKLNPIGWTADPEGIVTALHEPVYVLHYFRALTEKAAAIADRAPQILKAAGIARIARWTPTNLGTSDFDFEPDWRNVDTATVTLAAALARNDGDLAGDLDTAWTWATDLIDLDASSVEIGPILPGFDHLHQAINSDPGRGLEAIFGLAGWERGRSGAIRPAFTQLLDEILRLPGQNGMGYRAVLAQNRVSLEGWKPEWLEQNASVLFGDDELGNATFDLTIAYSRPTQWFYDRFRDQLLAAARRHAEHATSWLLCAAVNHVNGYAFQDIVKGLRRDVDALKSAIEDNAFLVQELDADAPQLDAAVEFWRALLRADRRAVPAEALQSSGRWAFVKNLPDDIWLQLIRETLEITGGIVDMPMYVADRCEATQPKAGSRSKIMLLLLNNDDEPWERDHVARIGVETLQTETSAADDFRRLQTRLIELGYHSVAEITPPEPDVNTDE